MYRPESEGIFGSASVPTGAPANVAGGIGKVGSTLVGFIKVVVS